MKIPIAISGIVIMAAVFANAATNEMTTTLQKGLFEEEANHNLEAAIQAYQSVVNQFDNDRKLAATAVFRLAECYRKQGATNQATAQYERVLREFADQTPLVASSRQGLALFGVGLGPSSAPISVGKTDAEQQEIRRIEELLRDSPDLINARGKNGETLLQSAAAKGQLNVVKTLLDWGAGVNVNSDNISPLHYAAGNGHKSVVDVLIQRGAKLDAETDSGVMPLHLAALKSYTLVAKALIDAGAPANARVRQAVNRSEGDLQYGFAGGESPLDLAIANDSETIVALLVAAKADLNSGSPLRNAAAKDEKSMVALLLDHGADVAATDLNGDTALHAGVRSGHPEVVTLLLARGADINARNKSGATPLHTAAAAGSIAIMEALVARGADLNQQDDSGSTPLRIAVSQGKVDAVRVLLAHKADPNIKDSNGFTPLHIAVGRGDTRIVQLLLEARADSNSKNSEGATALILAADRSDLNSIGLLLDHNADVEARVNNGKTALMIAVERRDKGTLELLLAHKANPNARDSQGNSALHFLALLPNRSGVGLPALPGQNPMFRSVIPAEPKQPSPRVESAIAELLLGAGADVNAQNNEGKTPLQYVYENLPNDNALAQVVGVLRKHGALENPPDFSSIRVTRKGLGGTPIVVFRRDTNGINRFTLAEALLNCLSSERPPFVLAFPDLSRIKIIRSIKGKAAEQEGTVVNILNPTNGIDCAKDTPLQFGDEVEVSEREHALSEPPVGLTENQRSDLRNCLKRKVTFVVKGEPTEVTLSGNLSTYLANALNLTPVRDILRSSSDLSNIHIRRTDPLTGEVKEFVRNEAAVGITSPGARLNDIRDDLWLRDGDVIEVPDKP